MFEKSCINTITASQTSPARSAVAECDIFVEDVGVDAAEIVSKEQNRAR